MKPNGSIQRALVSMTGALVMTNAVAQGVPQNPTTLSETYDAWTVQCVNVGEGEQQRRACRMSQELLHQESRQRVLLFAVTKDGENSARATLILPFGLLLSEGIRIEVAEKEVVRGAYRTCLPAGCVVEIELPDPVVEQLQAGDKASVFMTDRRLAEGVHRCLSAARRPCRKLDGFRSRRLSVKRVLCEPPDTDIDREDAAGERSLGQLLGRQADAARGHIEPGEIGATEGTGRGTRDLPISAICVLIAKNSGPGDHRCTRPS